MQVQNILVPIDYSDHAQQALQWGASLAEKYGATLLLLHVIPTAVEEVYPEGGGLLRATPSHYEVRAPGQWVAQPIIIDHVDSAQTELHDFAVNHLQDAVPRRVHVAVGQPAAEIVRVAREENVDLVVMGTHGRTGVRHLLLGSVAEDVTRHAPCPVFTVRIGDDETS
jgi:nucleotide-binding universal stress UspA family protein